MAGYESVTVTEALVDGPLTAQEVADKIGASLESAYVDLVAAEARGEVRVIVDRDQSKRQWEKM